MLSRSNCNSRFLLFACNIKRNGKCTPEKHGKVYGGVLFYVCRINKEVNTNKRVISTNNGFVEPSILLICPRQAEFVGLVLNNACVHPYSTKI